MKKLGIEMEKDVQLLKAIARTGLMVEKLLPLLGISETRLRQHIASGYIEKKGVHLLYGNATNIYMLSSKGKKKVQSEFAINLYKSDLSQLEHDYILLRVYLYLQAGEKESWQTESKLQLDYPQSAKTSDAMYINISGKRIGVEIITDSYTKDDIDRKIDFIRYHCDDYIMLHTHRDIEYVV
jgi:hypothetical protein